MTRTGRRWARGGIAAAVAAAAVAGMSAWSDDPAITACAGPQGQLRSVGSPAECRASERIVQWGITGPQGPPGARGPAGPGFEGDQFYTVGAGDFRTVTNLPVQSLAAAPGGTFVASGTGPLIAGVHLPQGADISGLSAFVHDASASNLLVELLQQTLDTGVLTAIASLSSATSPPLVASASASVDNSQYQYLVRVTPLGGWTGTTLQVLGATVSYRLPASVP